ncbi:hypothetical protein C2845_PM03G27940 [Panicum miliaceum]|uniref:LOB domain-containing protein n=1 Tax=Panicum miliaceum TaxID=4540 RepID=A0A3L6T7F7_PANMI|nr:hypothetical protein C2845_PM03G27940 [Panicum miliaceum]
MTGFGSPCGACKFLRRKCVKGCVFAPYFCHGQGAAHFAAIHKVFGASNASKLLMHLPDNARCEAALTISYEAQARLRDPVYGCVAHIFALQQKVVTLQAQLASLKGQASQGYTNEFSMSGTQQDSNYVNKFMDYQQEEGGMPHPLESCASVKNESQHYLGSDILTCTSMQSHQLHNPHQYRSDSTSSFNTDNDPSCTTFYLNLQEDVQKNGYYRTDDLQSMAPAYLN